MESLRLATQDIKPAAVPCHRCHAAKRRWDRIAGRALCPECQESLVLGLSEPFVAKTEGNLCAACGRRGTVRYVTFPLQSSKPLEVDLCPEHLRALLGRRLGPYAFHQLRRRLHLLGLGVELVFLLHDSFYDENGKALQPAELPE